MPVLKAREKLGAGVNEMCCVAIMKFDELQSQSES